MAFIRDEEQLKQLALKQLQQPSATAQAFQSAGFGQAIRPMGATPASQTATGERAIGGRAPLLADYLRANRQSAMAQKAKGDIEKTAQTLEGARWEGSAQGPQGFTAAPQPSKPATQTASIGGPLVNQPIQGTTTVKPQTPQTAATQPIATQATQTPLRLQPMTSPASAPTPMQAATPTRLEPLGLAKPVEIKPMQAPQLTGVQATEQMGLQTKPIVGTLRDFLAGIVRPKPQEAGVGIVGMPVGGSGPSGSAITGTINPPGVVTEPGGTGEVGFAVGASPTKPGVTGTIGKGEGLTLAEQEAIGARKPDLDAAQALLDAQRTEQEAAMLGSEAGRQAYLQQKFGKGQSYTQGESLLDAALMGALSGDTLRGLKGKYSQLYETVSGRQKAEQETFSALEAARKQQEEGDLQTRLQQAKSRTAAERKARDAYAEAKRKADAWNRQTEWYNAEIQSQQDYLAGRKSKAEHEQLVENLNRFRDEDADLQRYKQEGWGNPLAILNTTEDDFVANALKEAGF